MIAIMAIVLAEPDAQLVKSGYNYRGRATSNVWLPYFPRQLIGRSFSQRNETPFDLSAARCYLINCSNFAATTSSRLLSAK